MTGWEGWGGARMGGGGVKGKQLQKGPPDSVKYFPSCPVKAKKRKNSYSACCVPGNLDFGAIVCVSVCIYARAVGGKRAR